MMVFRGVIRTLVSRFFGILLLIALSSRLGDVGNGERSCCRTFRADCPQISVGCGGLSFDHSNCNGGTGLHLGADITANTFPAG